MHAMHHDTDSWEEHTSKSKLFQCIIFSTGIFQVPPKIRFILLDVCKPLFMLGFKPFNWVGFIKCLCIVF